VGFGFRYFLIQPDGEPADPGVFLTAIPSWKVGDEFLAGANLTKFRILDIQAERLPKEAHGVFTVEPLER
jgi:hypothetical protein